MTKLGRKTKELVSEGKLKLVPDSSKSPRPHVHLCEECNELIPCYNRDPRAPFCLFKFKLFTCWECYQMARIGYSRPKPINQELLNNQIGYIFLDKRAITNIIASLDPKIATFGGNKDRYWNTIYMDEIENIGNGWPPKTA